MSVYVSECACVFEQFRFIDATLLSNFFGALLPDSTSATVAVSAQQGCKMQASGRYLVLSALLCDDLQINACHISPANGCGLHTCDQAECTMVNSRYRRGVHCALCDSSMFVVTDISQDIEVLGFSNFCHGYRIRVSSDRISSPYTDFI